MTSPKTDRMIRAIASHGEARATILVTTALTQELRRRHGMDPLIAAATSRVAASALLLSTSIKGEQSITVELRAHGPLSFARATADAHGHVRAYASIHTFPEGEERPADIAAAFGPEGRLRVLRDTGSGEPYQGITPLVTGNVAHDLTFYYTNSEQARSAVGMEERLSPDGTCEASCAFLVQMLPPAELTTQAELRHLTLAEQLAERVEALPPLRELLKGEEGLEPEVLLAELFPEGFSILSETPIGFRCSCSRERMLAGLQLVGQREVETILAEDGEPLRLHCHFCSSEYLFMGAEMPWREDGTDGH